MATEQDTEECQGRTTGERMQEADTALEMLGWVLVALIVVGLAAAAWVLS